jgi:hypothetical protein
LCRRIVPGHKTRLLSQPVFQHHRILRRRYGIVYLARVVVVPLITSNVSRVYPGEALITINGNKNKAMTDQIMSADKSRFKSKILVCLPYCYKFLINFVIFKAISSKTEVSKQIYYICILVLCQMNYGARQ